ncbi:MAG TPA: hypothetical protein VND93_30905 [Myxococcales bacterium]|nr:hypothetical protein [Myxococcales bacterium]
MTALARRRRRAAGGHVLVEALASAAILIWAMSGLAAGLIAGSRLMGTAQADRAATDAVTAQVERLRALPTTNAAWAAGTTNAPVAGHPTWVLTTVVVDQVDASAGPVPLNYKHATVSITYGASTHVQEAFK